MHISKYTPVPKYLLKYRLSYLNGDQLKVLLIILDMTLGFYDYQKKKRRSNAWITLSFFARKTGLSARSVAIALNTLIQNDYVLAFNQRGRILKTKQQRKGHQRLYYAYAPYYRYMHDRNWLDKLASMFTVRRKKHENNNEQKKPSEILPTHPQKASKSQQTISALEKKLNKGS